MIDLYSSALNGDEQALREGILSGADVNGRGEDAITPLTAAALSMAPGCARILLEAGARPDLGDANGATALMVSCARLDIEMTALLLGFGANPNILNLDGQTALALAASQDGPEPLEIARMLLAERADPNLWGAQSCPPLSLAAGAPMAKLLLAAGADPNAQDLRGETPLMAAASLALRDKCEALVEAGADIDFIDSNGQSAIERAEQLRQTHPEILDLLLRSLATMEKSALSQDAGEPPLSEAHAQRI